MKENEVPYKIYLSYETDNEDYNDHIFINYMWHRHPFEGKNLKNVEYTRSDAFIEKATWWLLTNASDYVVLHNGYDTKELVKDFVDAMKRE